MNILLFLSAFLSALTGVGVGARRPEVTQAVSAQTVAGQPARAVAITLVHRPVEALPTLIVSAVFDRSAMPVLISTTDLWASRRRE